MRRNLVLWFVLLLTGFLTGFILQYARLQRVRMVRPVSFIGATQKVLVEGLQGKACVECCAGDH